MPTVQFKSWLGWSIMVVTRRICLPGRVCRFDDCSQAIDPCVGELTTEKKLLK